MRIAVRKPRTAIKLTESDISRFWHKVTKTDSCWVWAACTTPKGYGQFTKHGHYYAHRIAWELTFGPIPDGLLVLHNCPGGDNPSCVRPTHLFLGTSADNSHDMTVKGRSLRGDRHPLRVHPELRARGERSSSFRHPRKGSQQGRAKLVESQIPDIRQRASMGEPLKAIAQSYSVSHATIWEIANGRKWKHVPTALPPALPQAPGPAEQP